MISLEECRKILGDEACGLSDAELELLRQQAYGFADIVLSLFLAGETQASPSPSKEPPG
jgi:hypothetical protein